MSAESELRAVLLAHAPLLAVVPAARISLDEVPPTATRPYIMVTKTSRADDLGMDNTVLAVTSSIDLHCVGTSRQNSIAVADLVRDALLAGGAPSDRSAAGYDAETGFEVEVVSVEWFDV